MSVQYRVGVLGFPYVFTGRPVDEGMLMIRLQEDFAREGLTNLGLKDIKLALQWVQTNINSFRGDPSKVNQMSG